jgi:hypothetical protein
MFGVEFESEEFEMEKESIQNVEVKPQKEKRAYNRKAPQLVPQQPIAPNPNLIALEAGIVPLVNQRLEANGKVRIAAGHANQANTQLQAAQNELAEIEQEINYRMNLIGQLKNGGMPIPQQPYVAQNYGQPDPRFAYAPPSPPYNPVAPYPTMPPSPGVSSFPGRNDGLYPDAAPRGPIETDPERLVNAAGAADFMTPELRAQFRGGQ